MTERERLIKLIHMGIEYARGQMQDEGVDFAYGDVADHILSNGVIVLPCKVGDRVFIIDEGDEATESYVLDVVVTALGYDIAGFWITMSLPLGLKQSGHVGESSIGKTVFLTKEEAEKALKERSKENG